MVLEIALLVMGWLVMWSEIDRRARSTTTAPSIVDLASPPEGAAPALTTSDATYSAHFRKESGKENTKKKQIKKIENQKSKIPHFLRAIDYVVLFCR